MAKKVLVFFTATLFLVFVGLWVLYFYSHTSTNKKNSILTFIPSQTEFVIRISETSKNTNEFFSNPLIEECFRLDEVHSYWSTIDSITSRNYKTADILTRNTSYICVDSNHHFLILVDLNKKTNDHFIDQFLANSTSQHKIEKFKEGYKAFYPEEGKPIYYFVKHNVFALSGNADFLLSSLNNVNLEKTDSLVAHWNDQSSAKISIWGKKGTEASVIDSFINADIFFNGWIDRLSTQYFLDIEIGKDQMTFSGQLNIDSLTFDSYLLMPMDQKLSVLDYVVDTGTVINQSFSSTSIDSLGKVGNLVYTYHQFMDSANNNAQLLISNSQVAKYMFKKAMEDTSVQVITMADERISKIAVMNWKTASQILPIIPIKPDTGKLFGAIYEDYFFISNHTTTILQIAPSLQQSIFIKNTLEKGTILTGSKRWVSKSNLRSDYSLKLKNGVILLNCTIKLNPSN